MNIEFYYNKYYVQLYKFALKLSKCEILSDDLVQDAFVKLHEKKGLSDSSNIRAWLYKVIYNDFINQVKRSNTLEKILSLNESSERVSDTDKNYDDSEIRNIVINAIDLFPERQKAILLLYYDGLSYADIATVLEMNPNSVGKTLSRSISKLTNQLKQQYHELFT